MINSNDYIRAWEQRVSADTAHIPHKEHFFEIYKKAFEKTSLHGKTVIDFGCGGGWTGKYLFAEKKIKAYLGIDIAQRSLDAAKKNLSEYPNSVFLLIDPNALPDFSQMTADYFVSLSCIQHFPDKEYLDYFLRSLNKSGIKNIILQVKYSKETKFREVPYKTTHDIGNACFTNSGYILSQMTNYKMDCISRERSEYQYMRLKLNELD